MTTKCSAVLILLFTTCFAAFEIQSVNTTSIALGNIISLYPGSQNPAALVESVGTFARFDYTRLFGIKDLNYYETRLSRSFRKNIAAGFNFQMFGNSIYQEKTLGIQVAKKYLDIISVGLAAQLYHIMIIGYQNSTAAGITLGICYFLNERLTLATLFQNINNPTIYSKSDPLPQCFTVGIRYKAQPKVEFSGELFKDTEFPFSTRAAVLIKALPFIDVMMGVQHNPDRYSGGLSLHWKKLRVDLALQHHLVLPYTLYCGIGIGF
jgi:hypothetical protein